MQVAAFLRSLSIFIILISHLGASGKSKVSRFKEKRQKPECDRCRLQSLKKQ